MKKIKLLLVAIMLYSSFAIAQTEDKAKVIIIRESGLAGSASPAKILMNGVEITKLSNNRYFEIEVDPGNYNFSADFGGLSGKKKGEEFVKLKVEANNFYYLQTKVTTGLITRIYLEEITKNTFENKVSGLKKSEKDN